MEIDTTSQSLARFSIYARLGIPEIWCDDAGNLKIYHLQAGQYIEVERSQIFLQLDVSALPQLIAVHRAMGRWALRRAIRAWVKQQVGQS